MVGVHLATRAVMPQGRVRMLVLARRAVEEIWIGDDKRRKRQPVEIVGSMLTFDLARPAAVKKEIRVDCRYLLLDRRAKAIRARCAEVAVVSIEEGPGLPCSIRFG